MTVTIENFLILYIFYGNKITKNIENCDNTQFLSH